jgi:dihydroxyacetone kinase
MKRFINKREDLVQESLQGLIAASGGWLNRLDGYPEIKVVVRSDWNKQKVALISGGGSGHEPAHAGFVGRGMLTAAVCGEIFASPSVEAVLAAILAVTGSAGALLIVKNYTGDRLNFGLAAERARLLGLKVEMVIVADDASLAPSVQPRGLAGTLFVHKIAGHYAESGEDLRTVARIAAEVASCTRSLGLALTTCHTPGSAGKELVPEDMAELGLGIHGEPGVQRVPLETSQDLVDRVVEGLARQAGRGPYCALFNNLGAVPPLEMSLLLNCYMSTSLAQETELVVGPSHLMTSYDMNGFSISLLSLDDAWREALLSEVRLAAWPGVKRLGLSSPVSLPESAPNRIIPSRDDLVRGRLAAMLQALRQARNELNALDARVGDADAGDTIADAAGAIEARLDQLPLADPGELLSELSRVLGHAGGSSGILLAIFTGAAATEFRQQGSWPAALRVGLQRMMHYGGAKLGDRTMLDALHPAIEALEKGGSLGEAAALAQQAAASTAHLTLAGAGRSAYLGADSLRGNIDPGARAVAIALEAASQVADI